MKKIKKLTLRAETIRKLDLLGRVVGGNVGNTGNTIGVPASDTHICRSVGCGVDGTQGVPCWDSFLCYSVDC